MNIFQKILLINNHLKVNLNVLKTSLIGVKKDPILEDPTSSPARLLHLSDSSL
jgi:hypothetical protein